MVIARFIEAEQQLWTLAGARPREHRIPLERLGTTVRVQEVGEGTPVVFLHGASNAGSSWARLAARLEGFRCLLVDRPGCGLSDPLPGNPRGRPDLAPTEVARSLLADLLDGLALSSAHVVATSFGALAALLGAATHPDRIDRVVQLGWPVGAPIAHVPLAMRISAIRPLGLAMAAMPVSERSVRSMLRSIGLRRAIETGRFSDEELAWFLALLGDTDTMRNELRSGRYLSLRHGLAPELIVADDVLASIRSPMLLLWGDEDPFGGQQVAEAFAARIPDATLTLVAAAGHALWIDEPERTVEAITGFLDAQVPDPAVRDGAR